MLFLFLILFVFSGTQKEHLSLRSPVTGAICELFLRLQGAALVSNSDTQSNTWPRNKKNRLNSDYDNVNNEDLLPGENKLYSQSSGKSVPDVIEVGSNSMTGCGALIPENLLKMLNINYYSDLLDNNSEENHYTRSQPSLNLHSVVVNPKQNGLTQKLKVSQSFQIQPPKEKLNEKSESKEDKKDVCDTVKKGDVELNNCVDVKIEITPCDDYADIDDIMMDSNLTVDKKDKAKSKSADSVCDSKDLRSFQPYIPHVTPPTLPRRAKSFSVASKTKPKMEISSKEYAKFRPSSKKWRSKRRKSLDSAVCEGKEEQESVSNLLLKFKKSSKPAKFISMFEKSGRIFRRASLSAVKREIVDNQEILCHSENDLTGSNRKSKYTSTFISNRTSKSEFSSQPEVRMVAPSSNVSDSCPFMMPEAAPFHPAPSYSFENILNKSDCNEEDDNIDSVVTTGNTRMYYDHLLEYLGEVVEELDEMEAPDDVDSVAKEIKENLSMYSKEGPRKKVKRTPSQLAAHESIYMAMDSSVHRKTQNSPKRKISDTTYVDMTQVTR